MAEEAGEAGKATEAKREVHEPEPPVVTQHEMVIGSKTLRYSVTTGLMPIRNEAGEIEATLFYMAYTRDDVMDSATRPLMFSFNGGPGSSSVWLHLGALGPKRVQMLDDGGLPPPPYRLVDNEHTWLDATDLVFLDPVGTGYSRPAQPDLGKKFWGMKGDIESVGEFIRLYLTRNARWSSPLFLVGESYGTTRAAGLAGHLIEQGIAFNGIALVSSVLNFQTLEFEKGNDLPYILFLPSYTATAWYHQKLPAELQKRSLRSVLDEAELWAEGEYALALARGDRLGTKERQETIVRLARYTGLDKTFVDQSNLRITQERFCKELLRDQHRTVGRLDSRFRGIDGDNAGADTDHDPSLTAIRPPYTACFVQYARVSLGYQSDDPYYILGGGIKTEWDWGGNARSGYPDTSEALRSALAKNPYMRILVTSGYYDLATPYFATEYTLSHMGLAPTLRDNISTAEYESGHMMYIHVPSLGKLKQDVVRWLAGCLDNR